MTLNNLSLFWGWGGGGGGLLPARLLVQVYEDINELIQMPIQRRNVLKVKVVCPCQSLLTVHHFCKVFSDVGWLRYEIPLPQLSVPATK